MKCLTCEHRVHPDGPKYHDQELCARVTKLEEQTKSSPSRFVTDLTNKPHTTGTSTTPSMPSTTATSASRSVVKDVVEEALDDVPEEVTREVERRQRRPKP